MLGQIKFAILKWLLDDICINSKCKDCELSSEAVIGNYIGLACCEDDVLRQARKVWGIK